ncbi:oligomeric Golgi complex subunit 6 [Ephemerocybe angulata]|uniref:Conserved oligomeric Golgi complex subunit 6 n=1 Tax=Ephemerocybe angulata TaxID=980116 RepID=A0A8H6LTR4_9AGAR|nr:oligomeric Golgi complex subunit 6 [Tulosesus angulatus]
MSSLTPTTSSSPSITSPSAQTQAKNPISLRLYKVLSTNFEDYATREALGTLSELYGTPDADADGALIGEHAAKARRSLTRDMENKLAESSATFVEALGEVDQKLTELQTHISAMHMACAEAEEQLRSTNDASKTVLERAGTLRDERQSISAKSTIITLFLASFTLSQDEMNAMTSRDVPVGAAFFAAMEKCEKIREDCRVLMAGEEGPTRAGLDIMHSTSTALEAGYEKILRFLTHEFRRTGKDLCLEVNDTIQEGVKRLQSRPELLSEALSILASTRQNALLTSFLHALTRGGPSGLPRPIELHAHDPIRYVGDMLAWVHQAIAAEREFLGTVFGRGEEGAGRMVGSVRRFSKAEAGEEEWIRELMDIGVGGLVGPLKNRVLQTVKSQESSIVSYKIANLLMFYWVTMRRTVGEESEVTKGLEELTEAAYKVLRHPSKLRDLDDPALTPPLYILDHAQVLKEVMSVYQSSILDEEQERLMSLPSDADHTKTGEKKKPGLGSDFGKVLDVAIDPVVESVIKGGEEKGKLRPRWDASVWIVNCLTYILSVLEPFSSFTQEKQEGIKTLLDTHVAALIEEHTTSLLDESGLLAV